jgi:hypothetical protein
MTEADWAKIYAAMDKRLELKYEQLPRGEQIGRRAQPTIAPPKKAEATSLGSAG